jgi:hypothetical protein
VIRRSPEQQIVGRRLVSRVEALADAHFRSELSIQTAGASCRARGGPFTRASPSVRRRAALQAQPFNLHLRSHYMHRLDSVYDEFVEASTRATGSTADCRRTPPLPRADAVAPRSAARTFRSAFYTRPSARCYMPHEARLRTVAAMLILAFVPLIVSRYDGLPIVAIRPAFRRRAWHSRPPKR